jgi:hypothetical protein
LVRWDHVSRLHKKGRRTSGVGRQERVSADRRLTANV